MRGWGVSKEDLKEGFSFNVASISNTSIIHSQGRAARRTAFLAESVVGPELPPAVEAQAVLRQG